MTLAVGAVVSQANAHVGVAPRIAEIEASPESVLFLATEVGQALPGVELARAALAAGDPMHAVVAADHALSALKLAVQAGGLGASQAEAVATELLALRAEAIWAVQPPPRGNQGAFLRRTVGGAMLGDWLHGVPASVTLAQAVLESNWGRSAPGHNLFGMKGKGPAGSTVRRVVEYRKGVRSVRQDPFRAYHSEAEAMADHARLLGTRPRYKKAISAGEDRRKFARALVGVYASDPRYATKLDKLIVGLRLDRFDWAQTALPEPDLAPPVMAELPYQLPTGWSL